jgi:hypothetical protein
VAKRRNIPPLDGVFSPSYMKAFFSSCSSGTDNSS